MAGGLQADRDGLPKKKLAILGGRAKCDDLGIKDHVQCFVGDNCYNISGDLQSCLESRGYMKLTNPSFFSSFHKTLKNKENQKTYCDIIILMLKDEAVRRLMHEKRVKLYSGMVIKQSAEILFSDPDDLFKQIRKTIEKSQFGSDITYCEIDFKANASNPIKLPEDFECIITDNNQTKKEVESILKTTGLKLPIYLSPHPAYRK